MVCVVLFYGWIMQEKETSVIREGKGSAEGTKSLLPGSGVSPVHFPLLPGRRRRPASGT
jgi:hypothetical protein